MIPKTWLVGLRPQAMFDDGDPDRPTDPKSGGMDKEGADPPTPDEGE